jgi:1-acyl-sn-glycerol-3-phosphate acyltransferase
MTDQPERQLSRLAWGMACVRSALAYLLVSFYILFIGPPALVIAVLFRRPRLLVVLGVVAVRLARGILGLRCRVHDLERVVGDRPAVYCVNHASNVDVVAFEIVSSRCRRLKGLYKADMGRIPILGRALKVVQFVALERGRKEQTIQAVEQATRMLENGDSFMIAPEGTRSPTGDLQPFKKGAFFMAIAAQVPVVPVAIRGGRVAMPRGSAVITPAVLDVCIGVPIETTGTRADDRDRLAAEVRAQIEGMLAAG